MGDEEFEAGGGGEMIAFVIVLLLWPVSGWAANDKRMIEAPGMPIMVCSDNLTNCTVDPILLDQHAFCYQRMREVIVLMNRWLKDAEADNVSIHGGIYPNVKRHWADTMRECVNSEVAK